MSKNSDIRCFFAPRLSTSIDVLPASTTVHLDEKDSIESHFVDIYDFPSIPSYPSKLIVGPISSATIPSFKRLLSTTLPVPYSSKFFSQLSHDQTFCHLAFWDDMPALWTGESPQAIRNPLIGGIKARMEDITGTTSKQLYIETLSLFAPYRGIGIGKCLLNELLQELRLREPEGRAQSVYAHVWESNQDGLRWYLNQGFFIDSNASGTENGLVRSFYRRLVPSGAWIVRLNISLAGGPKAP